MKVKTETFLPVLPRMAEILNKGKPLEIKIEQGNIVIIEIERHATIKTPING